MAKRQIDGEMFKDDWFWNLSPQQKLLWIYAITNADCAGIVSLNPSILTPVLGWKIKDSEVKAVAIKMTMLRHSTFIINNFIMYQHGYLGGKSKMLIGVKSALFKYGMDFCIESQMVLCNNKKLDRVSIPLVDTLSKGIEIEDKVEVEVEEKRGSGGETFLDFDAAWSLYPKKLGRGKAIKIFNATVKTDDDFTNVKKAIENYKNYTVTNNLEEKYIKHGSTFFGEWKDWVNFKSEERKVYGFEGLKKKWAEEERLEKIEADKRNN